MLRQEGRQVQNFRTGGGGGAQSGQRGAAGGIPPPPRPGLGTRGTTGHAPQPLGSALASRPPPPPETVPGVPGPHLQA